MRLTVLGKSPAWQDAGGACSGYLIEEADTSVLVDCGNGVFGKLRARMEYVDIDAVVISHLHADHFLDLVPFSYALIYAPRQQPMPVDSWPGTDDPAWPELHVPPGAAATFRRVVGAWGREDLIEKAFDLREYEASSRLEIGPMQISFQSVPHYTETFAMCICSSEGPGRIIYGADSSPTQALSEFAAEADLILVEATLPRPERNGKRGHLTPGEAGQQARAAGARRLVLVHISDELDTERARVQAEEAFGGPVEVAAEGATFEV
jgi:ribonuclease BN (tRNA processing enzyme)